MSKYLQGRFSPRHPEKYSGDHRNIIYRSGLELGFMMKLDHDPEIISWSSEETIVPYTCPVDGRFHRYFPDMVFQTKDGQHFMVEIKPKDQTKPPKRGKGGGRRFLAETKTYARNVAKWESAERYCAKRGWKFQIITEKDLGVTF